jgi:hypothetical protein
MPLLWHFVPADRMWFATGVLIALLALAVMRRAGVRVTGRRAAATAAAALALHAAARLTLGGEAWNGALAAFAAALAAVTALRARLAAAAPAALIGTAALANAVAFGGFNPLQSARPIFHPPAMPQRAALDRLAARQRDGWLVVGGSDGSWPNGLGYAAAGHVLYAPALDFFRPRFPSLPEPEFEHLFNRTLHTLPALRPRPTLNGDAAIWIPFEAFDAPRLDVAIGGGGGEAAREGSIEERGAYSDGGVLHVVLRGWAPFDGSDPASRLRVLTPLPVVRADAYAVLRGDVAAQRRDPRLLASGFELRLALDASVRDDPGRRAAVQARLREPICVVSESPTHGRFRLLGDAAGAACPSRPASEVAADPRAQQPEPHRESHREHP